MAEQEVKYSKKIEAKKVLKVMFLPVIIVIMIIVIFIIIAGASVAVILDNDSSDKLASSNERSDLKNG